MAKTENPSEVIPGTIFTPRQVQILKIAVIVMGIILVIGFAFVIAAIVYQASNLSKSTPQPVASPQGGMTAELIIPDGMAISQMALGDNRLAVHLTGPRGGEIRIIDLGTGAVLTRIPIKGE